MSEVNEEIKELIAQIRANPTDPASITEHIHAPFPNVQEATQVQHKRLSPTVVRFAHNR